jgi:hypothetical protein
VHLPTYPLPRRPARKGSLIQAAYSLFLFIHDICDDDLVGWLDRRLAAADPGPKAHLIAASGWERPFWSR